MLLDHVLSLVAMHAFRLFKLPDRALRNVLLTMNYMELVHFSMVTKRTKKAVTKLKLPALMIKKSIFDVVCIDILFNDGTALFLEFHRVLNHWHPGKPRIKLENVELSHVDVRFGILIDGDIEPEGAERGTWRWGNYTYKKWVQHLLNLFDYAEIDKFDFYAGSERFDVGSLLANLYGNRTNRFSIASGCENGHHLEIHRALKPLNNFVMSRVPYPNRVEGYHLISENIENLSFRRDSNLTLDEILLLNCVGLVISKVSSFSTQDINRYLKLWSKGANRRLEYLHVCLPDGSVLEKNAVFKGVKYQTVSNEKEELFENVSKRVALRGGFEVWAKSGRRANIQLEGTNTFQMCVWP